ncbi:MAG: adenine-specific methyltransferase [Clostridiaceae bacterium]|jgi:hypothetical protein|nr:adenine-specific methyltransferase [Clostridiaceae bacterium]
MKNNNLKNAKKEKNDEFYTQLSDIEKELKHYKEQLKDKNVFCNCDDPEYSNFWNYFKLNFEHLGLKTLIATHYEKVKPSYKLEFDGKDTIKTDLKQNGDFRSPESVEILKQSDIIITNPPFSLFREYIGQLIEYDKKFLIIGNNNSITYKEVFSLIKENKIWLGYSPRSMKFKMPDNTFKDVNACWFTNLDTTKRHEKLILYKTYNEHDYPKYDNYDAINVNKVSAIPCDYNSVIGVPITFMDKYNPKQFEIIGQTGVDIDLTKGRPYINGKRMYARILIKRKG